MVRIKKLSCAVLASCVLVSLSGCRIPFINISAKKAAEELAPEICVTDWEGDVPDGMEVTYVVSREITLNYSRNRYEYQYEYDSYGRRTGSKDISGNDASETHVIYNDDGTIAERNYVAKKSPSGFKPRDYTFTYTYNDKGRLVSYNAVFIEPYGDRARYEKSGEFVYENGHLVSDGDNEYDYNFDMLPYYEYVVEVNEDSDNVFLVAKYYYDENNVRTAREINGNRTDYQYEDGVLTGWVLTYSMGTQYVYDAEGNSLCVIEADGNTSQSWTYNDHGDVISYEIINIAGLAGSASTSTYTYDYDSDGNKVKVTEEYRSERDGKEIVSTYVTTYEYEEHGLLVSEVHMNGKSFDRMTVYSYEAILVPQA